MASLDAYPLINYAEDLIDRPNDNINIVFVVGSGVEETVRVSRQNALNMVILLEFSQIIVQ